MNKDLTQDKISIANTIKKILILASNQRYVN